MSVKKWEVKRAKLWLLIKNTLLKIARNVCDKEREEGYERIDSDK